MGTANFANRLKELRVAAGLTQESLAERAKLSKAGIADLEQGRREPSWATVIALAEALGVTCQAFLEAPAPNVAETKRGRPPKPEATAPGEQAGKATPVKKRGGRKRSNGGPK